MATKRRITDAATETPATETPATETPATEDMTEATAKKPAKTRVTGTRLVGGELLAYTDANAPSGKTGHELAVGAGYFTKIVDTESGEETLRVHDSDYYKAVAEASRGIVITPSKRAYAPRRNRAQEITVGAAGNCVVGFRYTTMAGFPAGSKLSVAVENGRIFLALAAESAESADGGASSEGASDEMDL